MKEVLVTFLVFCQQNEVVGFFFCMPFFHRTLSKIKLLTDNRLDTAAYSFFIELQGTKHVTMICQG
ncbi:hypothetical protein ES703_76275 [subsurface metagenome]